MEKLNPSKTLCIPILKNWLEKVSRRSDHFTTSLQTNALQHLDVGTTFRVDGESANSWYSSPRKLTFLSGPLLPLLLLPASSVSPFTSQVSLAPATLFLSIPPLLPLGWQTSSSLVWNILALPSPASTHRLSSYWWFILQVWSLRSLPQEVLPMSTQRGWRSFPGVPMACCTPAISICLFIYIPN